jgi:hypothetical protein
MSIPALRAGSNPAPGRSTLAPILLQEGRNVQGGSNMTRTDFFFCENHNCQTLTCTCQSSTYSPPESTHFFQRSGSILMPFPKKACGWWRIHPRTVWMIMRFILHALSALSEALTPLKHTGPCINYNSQHNQVFGVYVYVFMFRPTWVIFRLKLCKTHKSSLHCLSVFYTVLA